MQRNLRILGVLALVACQGGGPTTGEQVRQFRAWCWSRSKPLGDWTTDEALAKKQQAEHNRLYPHHSTSVKVWTGPLQKPRE